jgi:anti-sigma B factor antagonist
MTIYTAASLLGELLPIIQGPGQPLELNLAGVLEFDTAGVQLLLLLQRECRDLHFADCSPVVRSSLDLCGLTAMASRCAA